MCAATLWDGVLTCTRTDAHLSGHTYGASEPGDTHYEPTEGDH